MIKRFTLLLLIIFIVLLGLLFVWKNQKLNTTNVDANLEEISTPESVDLLLNFSEDVFVRDIKIFNNEGESIEATRETEDDAWILQEPPAQDSTDSKAISDIVSSLELTTVDMTLADFTEFDTIGLKVPTYRIELGLSDGSTHEIQIGNETITNSQYYVRFDQSPPKVVSKINIDRVLDLINTPPIIPTSTPQPEITTTEGSP